MKLAISAFYYFDVIKIKLTKFNTDLVDSRIFGRDQNGSSEFFVGLQILESKILIISLVLSLMKILRRSTKALLRHQPIFII